MWRSAWSLPVVAASAAGTDDRLLDGVARENAEQDRQAEMNADLAQRMADGPVDVLVVRRLAANHGP